jgi:hypothetical protein
MRNLYSKMIKDKQGSYALFDKDVKAKEKYEVTTPPSLVFNTRKEAKAFAKRTKIRRYKILSYNTTKVRR